MDNTCSTCAYLDDYLDPGKCYADLEYHDPDDTCPFWAGSLRAVPIISPEAQLAAAVANLDSEIGQED